MTSKQFQFWTNWLLVANVVTIIVGFLVAFAGNSFIFYYHNRETYTIFHEMSGTHLDFKNWLWGVIGGTIVGFHVLMVFITKYAFAEKKRWAYRALWCGLLSWFVIDTGVSIYYNAFHNVYLINGVALFIIGLPLIMTRREFK